MTNSAPRTPQEAVSTQKPVALPACVNCVWIKDAESFNFEECAHPRAAITFKHDDHRVFVRGEAREYKAAPYCRDARDLEGECGPLGALFEPAPLAPVKRDETGDEPLIVKACRVLVVLIVLVAVVYGVLRGCGGGA